MPKMPWDKVKKPGNSIANEKAKAERAKKEAAKLKALQGSYSTINQGYQQAVSIDKGNQEIAYPPQFEQEGEDQKNIAKVVYGRLNDKNRQPKKIEKAYFPGAIFCQYKKLNAPCNQNKWKKLQKWLKIIEKQKNSTLNELEKGQAKLLKKLKKQYYSKFNNRQVEEKIFMYEYIKNVLKAYHAFILEQKQQDYSRYQKVTKIAHKLNENSIKQGIEKTVKKIFKKVNKKHQKYLDKLEDDRIEQEENLKEELQYEWEKNIKNAEAFFRD